ncbi:MAG: LURP-one-related family protein [Clostridia bacterium]|nr:LURP-one-related family protein [Clostridia bacterium]
MRLYIKQRVFTWGDKFHVYNENGNEKYYVEGEVFSFGKKLHLYDMFGNERAFIHQKPFAFMPRYVINCGGEDVAEVVKHFTFFHQEYSIEGLGWTVEGDFFSHEFSVYCDGYEIASVHKEWFTFGDAYAIDIDISVDEITALAVVLIIDAVIEQSSN